MKQRVTIKDIARYLKLSTSTVSRALADHTDVSSATRQLVRELAEEWEYQPDPIAISLKRKKTNSIGVIMPQIVNRFFSKAVGGIQHVANEHGYNLIITQSEESLLQEKKNIQALLNSRVDGLIVSLSKQTLKSDHFQRVIDMDTPLIFFDRVSEDLDTSKVIIDDYEASFNAVKHLIEQGCKRIAHIAGPQNLFNCRHRLEGYKDALKEHGIFFDQNLLIFASYESESIEKYTHQLLDLEIPPDGIFALNDASAIEMIYWIKKRGFKIPDDIAVVGFNNEAVSQFTDPPLTSVESPAYELGKVAALLLLDNIREEAAPIQCKTIKSKLVIRGSSLRK